MNVPVTFGLLHLAPLWPAFMPLHPKVELDITLADRLVDLVDEGYDVVVRIARLQTSSMVSRRLTSSRMVLCASPEYLRHHGAPAHPSELARNAVITYTLLSLGEHWKFEGPAGPVRVTVTPRMRTNSGDTCCVVSGALVEVLPEYVSDELGVFAVHQSRKHLPTKVRVLIDFLVEAFRMREWPA